MLRDRLIVGILGAILAISLLFMGNELILAIVISVIALMGLTEIYIALGILKKNPPLAVLGYIAGFAVLYFSYMANFVNIFRVFICAYIVILLIYMVAAHKKTSFSDVSGSLFATLYVTLLFSYLILIRKDINGKFLIWTPFIIAWLSDTLAYTFGRLFGKHKLIPEVSPKKTVEGAIGGIFGGVVFMVVYGLICMFAFQRPVNWLSIVLTGGIGAILSQLGDLAASWIKREKNIMDYGSILPGHGGVMDRFDSVLFVAPFVYYFIEIFPIF